MGWGELRRPFEAEQEITKPTYVKGKKTGEVTAVPWHEYVTRLNGVTNRWSSRVSHVIESAGQLMLVVEVEVAGVTHAGTGSADADKEGWGGAHAEAYSQAFRRACAHHGLGLYMYKDEEPADVRTSRQSDRGSGRPDRRADNDDGGARPDGDGPERVAGPHEPPTDKQKERLTELGRTGVFTDEELTGYKADLKHNWSKGHAGKIIREMKQEYERRTGKEYPKESTS